MKCFYLLPLALALACAPPKDIPKPVIVREYIILPAPEPQIPPRPTLATAQLKDPTLQELLKALLADREALAAWALDLETRLKAYLKGEDHG